MSFEQAEVHPNSSYFHTRMTEVNLTMSVTITSRSRNYSQETVSDLSSAKKELRSTGEATTLSRNG